MSEFQIAIMFGGFILAGFGVIWRIFSWGQDDIKKSMESIDDKVEQRHMENKTLIDTKLALLQAVRDQVQEKPSFEYIEHTYARRESVDLKLDLINQKLDSLMKR